VFWSPAFDYCGHDFGGDGGQEDAVAEVAGGDVVAGDCGGAEDGEGVGSCGAEAGPVLENFGVG
jgi:hypothetical protein